MPIPPIISSIAITAIDMHFAWETGKYALLFTPVIAYFFWRLYLYRRHALNNYASERVLKKLLVPRSSKYYFWQSLCLCLAWLFANLALMQPMGYGQYAGSLAGENIQAAAALYQSHEVIFLLDASASMQVADMPLNASRFDYAKDTIDEIISQLQGPTVSLYAFTSQVTQLSPPTLDYLYVRLMLRHAAINATGVSGTDFLQAMQYLQQQYASPPTPARKTVILLSDGGDTALEAEAAKAQGQSRIAQILASLPAPLSAHMRIFTVGTGSVKGLDIPGISYNGQPVHSALNALLLQEISDKGGGTYYMANDYPPISLGDDIAADIQAEGGPLRERALQGKYITAEGQSNPQQDIIYKLFYQFPLGLAILFLAGALLIPDLEPQRSVPKNAF